jgi:hypothetical protein
MEEDVMQRVRLDPAPFLRYFTPQDLAGKQDTTTPAEWEVRLGESQARCRLTIENKTLGALAKLIQAL